MPFKFRGLDPSPFAPLYGLSPEALAIHGAVRVTADAYPGFPCRVTLQDVPVGEAVLLLPYEHLPGPTPYRASGPIFVREFATAAYADPGVPPAIYGRLFSVRAYDVAGLMVDADVAEATVLDAIFERFFSRPDVDRLHLHHAPRGCFACEVLRA